VTQGPFIPVIKDFVLDHYDRVERVYTLKAREAQIDNKNKKSDVTKPVLSIYAKGARGATVVSVDARSKQGNINLDTKDIILEQDVIYRVIASKTVLYTSKLIYWSKRREIEVPEGTGYHMQTPNGEVEGSGMVSKEDLTR